MTPEFQQWTTLIATVVGVVATIGGIFGGVYKLGERKRERRFTLVQSILIDVNRSRGEYHSARNPFTYENEGGNELLAMDATSSERNEREQRARINRLKPLQSSIQKLQDVELEIGALTNKNLERDIHQLRSLYIDLINTVNAYFGLLQMMAKSPNLNFTSEESFLKLTLKVYGVPSDEHGQAVDAAVDKLVKQLQAQLSRIL